PGVLLAPLRVPVPGSLVAPRGQRPAVRLDARDVLELGGAGDDLRRGPAVRHDLRPHPVRARCGRRARAVRGLVLHDRAGVVRLRRAVTGTDCGRRAGATGPGRVRYDAAFATLQRIDHMVERLVAVLSVSAVLGTAFGQAPPTERRP